jgi:peptide/nickel transport system substrate-binding protein
MLADLVSQGKLPPVDQRLPKNPVVLDGIAGTGKHGGTIRRGYSGVSDYFGPNKVQQVSLVWYNDDLTIRPDLAESWEVSDDAKKWTFKLREGTKWSDGNELTTDDFKWWYDNVLNNETLGSLPNTSRSSWVTGKERTVMQAEFPDKYTAVFTFADPNPLFIYNVTRGQPFAPTAHMQQFHVDFADKAKLDAASKAAGFDTWDKFFDDRNRPLIGGRPSTGVWVPTNAFGDQLFVMERNPYFAQVDSAGNQLPYADKVSHLLFESPDAFSSRIIAGEVDYQARHVSIGNFTLFKESESQGDYSVKLAVTANHIAFQPNLTTKNEKLREFFGSRDVRIALSHAINRAEINDLVFSGTATPRQYSPLPQSPQYYEKLSNAYIDYDPEKANQLLDQAGYTQKDPQGIRLWKDGSSPISFTIEGTATPGSPDEDAVQTMLKYFADVGVQAAYKGIERALYTQHYNANEIESAFWGGDRTLLPLTAPLIFIGTTIDRPWAAAWGLWRLNPDDPNGQEPPADHWINKIWTLWDQISVEPDEQKRNQLFFQILDVWAEELPMITILGELPQPVIVKNGLQGTKGEFAIDDPTKDEQFLNPQTFYWDDPSKHTT